MDARMSSEAQGTRAAPLRGYRRRKAVLDLNVPPIEGRDDEGTSTQPTPATAQAPAAVSSPQGVQAATPTIDVEAFDDDVIVSSPRAFAEAKSNARRTRGTSVIVDVDSGRTTRFTSTNNRTKCRRVPSNQTIINCDLYINLEGGSSSTRETALMPGLPPPPPPPKEPIFNCPICLGPFVEETSTRCGHIFCKKCIKAAMTRHSTCPTCRKRITVKELIRVFLPATSSL